MNPRPGRSAGQRIVRVDNAILQNLIFKRQKLDVGVVGLGSEIQS